MCYVIIVIGGLLPSIQGNVKKMLTLKFWKTDYVKNTVLSEITIGLYDLLLSYVLKKHESTSIEIDSSSVVVNNNNINTENFNLSAIAKNQANKDFLDHEIGINTELLSAESLEKQFQESQSKSLLNNGASSVPILINDYSLVEGELENEFFFIAWCWFVIAFAFSYALNSRLRNEYYKLFQISTRIIILSGFGQCLTLFGYYASQFGYSWFYQPSVVHAAEASLAQAFNLLLAFVAKKWFDLGRESAISDMLFKVLSVIVVTVGLSLIAYRELLSVAQN